MQLPIADNATLWRRIKALLANYRGGLIFVVGLQALAAVAALAMPWLLGRLVDQVAAGTTLDYVNQIALILLGAVLIQAVLTGISQRAAMVLGESIFAELREQFLQTITHLPLSTVEKAGTGDLISRTTNDIDRVQWVIRFGIPQILVQLITVVLTAGAALLVSPAIAVALIVGAPVLILASRAYLKKATPAYLRNSEAYAKLNGVFTESIEHVDTVDALSLGLRRRFHMDRALEEAWDTEAYTLRLRAVLFFWLGVTFVLPPVAVIMWGTYLAANSIAGVTIGSVTTIAMYAVQIQNPIGELLFWLDESQVARASLSRIMGVDLVEPDRLTKDVRPADEHLVARGVKYSYVDGVEVLHGLDLDLKPGERLAIVGPSGAGKSTFGRMLAGIHPPTAGEVRIGGVNVIDLPEDVLRREVALVTQEHHVFVGTVADNLRLAKADVSEDEMWQALDAVAARTWVTKLKDGIETEVGSGAHTLTPAQAQQLALARLVLLDPHTLVLDEATSLLDPRAARDLERSLSAVLADRTVVAIAHRLHTAHDADRVAVIEDGKIVEIGPHDELVALGGAYAKLWASWQQE
ncbi:ABC transporter ATP-binding protein [Bowdeniella massiliensis]|uniref:ABC transporter ATP-binding protein n=1 Tax=Bowdeniella massiliensis TaxID=2932264 RepID=UPI002027C39E|nr:ABC transporter ATP-binding protein [Bowdeniella massiliensis]